MELWTTNFQECGVIIAPARSVGIGVPASICDDRAALLKTPVPHTVAPAIHAALQSGLMPAAAPRGAWNAMRLRVTGV
jgi:hypothetical protein